jgi:methylenetetrahydrofolate reductase (NADPH)
MVQNRKPQSILVVSRKTDLAEITRKAVEGTIEVDYASSESQALEKIRAQRPEIVILGYLEPPGAELKFVRELREGWISRHSSLIVIQLNPGDGSHRILGDENLSVGIGEYSYLAGESSPLFPQELLLPRLKEKILAKLKERTNRLKESILNPNDFCLTWEQIPGLGAFETRQELVLENAKKAAKGGKICAISITDNPGGNPAIATEILCSEVRKLGIEPLVHVAFRDKSRNQVESLLYQLAAMDINNLLVLTGDYPSNEGFKGKSRPVFDLDSVNGLQLIAAMNRGMEHEIMRKLTRLAPTDFFSGVAFSPFKQEEPEVMGQYAKLKKKIESGAGFIVTQVGYDVRKLHELQLWLKQHAYPTPVMTSVYILSYPAARTMHDNRVPGCVVTDKLLAQIAEESKSPDKGKQARLDRAARMYAIVKGLGLSGVCISGQGISYESVEYVVEKGRQWQPQWRDFLKEFDYPQENGFYCFEKEFASGLNLETAAPRKQKSAVPPVYLLSLALHAVVFEPRSPIFKMFRPLFKYVDSKRTLRRAFDSFEYWNKAVLYGCMNCGDCALDDVAYLCPVSQCPKNQRNGPCGGSFQGWCEVYPGEKKCIWVRAYRRLKSQNREDSIGDYIVPPNDWELWQTSSWLNYYMGRDHVSKRVGIKPPEPPKSLPSP